MLIKKLNKFSVKLYSLLILFMLVPSITIFYFAYHSSTKTAEGEIIDGLLQVSNEKCQRLELALNDIMYLAETIASEESVKDTFSKLQSNAAGELQLNKIASKLEVFFNQSNGLYENIFFGYKGKIQIDGMGGTSVGHDLEEDNALWYQKSKATKQKYIGSVLQSPITGRPVIVASVPILNENTNEYIGVFALSIEFIKLTENMVSSDNARGTKTVVLNSEGLVIASEDLSQVFSLDYSKMAGDNNSFYSTLKQSDSGMGYFTLNGVKNIAAYKKFEGQEMYVVTYLPVSKYLEKMNDMKQGVFLALFICLLVGIFVAFFFAKRITNPIERLMSLMKKVEDKDLTVEADIQSKDEFGQLARGFNNMLIHTRELISQVIEKSKIVAVSSQQLNSNAQQTAAVATETATTMGDIASAVEKVTTNIREVSAASETSAGYADEGSRIIVDVIAQMNSIYDSVKVVKEAIGELNKKSQEINQIVELITSISDQTNLLALNAAIEAARAGEQGRGFAVVADEVRKLAEQSSNATKEINNLIGAIQAESLRAVESMEKGEKEVETGNNVIQKVGDNFTNIMGAVQGLTTQIKDIVSLMEQTSEGVQNVETTTEEMTAAAEEVSASAESLSKLSDELDDSIGKFKI